jgi:hypothetical protein
LIWVLTEALGTSALLLLAQQCAGWDYFIEDVQAGFLAVDALVYWQFFLLLFFVFMAIILLCCCFFFQLIHFLPGYLFICAY